MKERKIRLYGSIKDLMKTGSNSTCNYYTLTLYVKYQGSYVGFTEKRGFNGYSKKEIYSMLKSGIIDQLKDYGIQAY